MRGQTFDSFLKTTILLAPLTAMVACSSSGGYRVAAVGDVPGATGDTGDGNGSGGTGSGSGSGSTGTGSGSGTGSTGTGGTGTGGTGTGSGSGGGTGSTGSTGMQGGLASGVITTAGNTVIGAAGKHAMLANTVNGIVPRERR